MNFGFSAVYSEKPKELTNLPPEKVLFFRINLYPVICLFMASLVSGSLHSTEPVLIKGIPLYKFHDFSGFESGLEKPQITKDQHGRILAAAGGQLYRFDGIEWEQMLTNEQFLLDPIVSIGFDEQYNLHVGTFGNWGQLFATKEDSYIFKSSKAVTTSTDNAYFDVMTTSYGVGFVGFFTYVWVYPDGRTVFFEDLYRVNTQFQLAGSTFIASEGDGLMKLENESLLPLEHIDASEDRIITTSRSISDTEVILGTEQAGLFLFDGVAMAPFETDCEEVTQFRIVDVEMVEDEFLVVALESWGLVILDLSGHLINSINYKMDPRFLNVGHVFYDGNGVLWAAVSRGMAQIFFPSRITTIDDRMGLNLDWPRVYSHQGNLLIRSNRNLFRGEANARGEVIHFEKVLLSNPPIRNLEEFPQIQGWSGIQNRTKVEAIETLGPDLLVATEEGSWIIHPDHSVSVLLPKVVMHAFFVFPDKPDVVLGVNNEGLYLFRKKQNRWVSQGDFLEAQGSHNEFYQQDASGYYWTERGRGQVLRFSILDSGFRGRLFTVDDGLEDNWINLYKIDGGVYFYGSQVIQSFDPVRDRFVEDPQQMELFLKDGLSIRRPVELRNADIVVPYQNRIILFEKQADGGYQPNMSVFSGVNDGNLETYPDASGNVWLRSQNRLLKYDADVPIVNTKPIASIIDKVIIAGKSQVLYHSTEGPLTEDSVLEYDFDPNGISIHFSSPHYSTPLPLKHQYLLQGYSNDWSEPTLLNRAEFIGLREGTYTFKLRAIDFLNRNSEISFILRVNPPYYRSKGAYLLYLLLTLFSGFLILKWIRASSEKEKSRLEALVQERTLELHDTAKSLKEAASQAEAASRAKSQFLANMSHEIRTPLNGVIGTIDLIESTSLNNEQKEMMNIVTSSSESLLSIIDDILDYSKIEANRLDIDTITFRLEEILQETVDILTEISCRKKIELFYEIESGVPELLVGDPHRLRQILINLGNNAVKFTEEGQVHIKVSSTDPNLNEKMRLQFEVKDTGIGIAEESLALLCRPFSQLDTSDTRIHGGTGLGLAICKGLLGLMDGYLTVRSKLGSGSTFSFSLPMDIPLPKEVESSVAFSQESLLILDFNASRSHAVQCYLTDRNLSVSCANDSDSMLQALRSEVRWSYILLEEQSSPEFDEIVSLVLEKKNRGELDDYAVLAFPDRETNSIPSENIVFKPLKLGGFLKRITAVLLGDLSDETDVTIDHKDIAKQFPLQILLVEDSLVNQRVGVKILDKLGYIADHAWDGHEALQKMEAKRYDLILMDVQMPGMDGLEATRIIREKHSTQPQIVGLTAGAMKAHRHEAMDAGMDDFLTKPIKIVQIERAIIAAFERVTHGSI